LLGDQRLGLSYMNIDRKALALMKVIQFTQETFK